VWRGFSKDLSIFKEAAAHIDLSLQQLKTDWIDIYQLHNVSNEEAFGTCQ